MVVRGTYLPNTVRCIAKNTQRAPSYTGLNDWTIDTGLGFITCYSDVRANAYILGSGPPTLTVVIEELHYWMHANQDVIEELRSSAERVFVEGGYHDRVDVPAGGIAGREEIMFIGPAFDVSVEAWQIFQTWDVQQREDDTVIAVHPARDYFKNKTDNYETYLSRLEMELPAFTQAVIVANQARVADYSGRVGADPTYPMLVTNATTLHQYYIDIGATSHPDGPPAQPPPPCGLAVPDQANNSGLMRDCMTLLAAKDTLRGTATLNWSVDTAIGSWDGITAGGTPSHVTKVVLPSESLTGTIPTGLGTLSALTHLDLSSNSLTGEIPRELGGLSNLEELRLSGNSFTGCIPSGLKDVPTNDLSSLNLLYCPPPAPEAPTAGTAGEGSVPLS